MTSVLPRSIVLWDDGSAASLDLDRLARYLRERTRTPRVEVRPSPFGLRSDSGMEESAEALARMRVRDPSAPFRSTEPMTMEIEYERRRIRGETRSFGILYEGVELQGLLRDLLPPAERRLDTVHMVFTGRLVGTWDENDLRYHARAGLFGAPSIVSTSGLVEAPARPREYYLLKRNLRVGEAALLREFRERVLIHRDERLTGVARGYAMQAFFYRLTGEAFCADPRCRLFNAHWQEELLRAQSEEPYEFCPAHEGVLDSLREEVDD